MDKTAVISECGTYRYHLTRYWGNGAALLFVMLNPSTADANLDDPTIRKCIGFAERNGCEGIEVVNLFAFRATDPRELKRAGYPIGPENNAIIRSTAMDVAERGGRIVCAWGANARGLDRADDVVGFLLDDGHELHALKLLDPSTPAHPLMLAYSSKLEAF